MASQIKVDTISEKTSANGVTIDSVSLKDGKVATANSIDSDAYVDGSIDTAHIAANQVTGAKLNTDVISAQTALTAEPADTDEFLVSDAGTLKRIDYSLIKASPGLNLLLTTTASSSSLVEFTNTYLTTTYDAYLIKLTNVHVSADASIYVQFKVGGSYLTSGYYYVCWRINAENAATGNANGSTGASQIRIDQESVGADTGENINYSIWLNDPAGTDNYKTIDYTGSGHNGTPDLSALSGVGDHQGAVTALDAIKIYPSTGNFASGTFSLYGVSK